MSEAAAELSQQYLTFGLGDESFAVDVAKAREVLDSSNITKVPQTPDYMLGVINLRGSVVPVIDMRLKFGMEAAERTIDTCIIVLEIHADDGEPLTISVQADSVQEVLDITESQIEPPPRLGTKLDTDFIKGMGNCNDEFVIILDIDKVFTTEELVLLEGAYKKESEKE
ncbi:MAG: chemotaxis protein CheW [Desulfuromonas sp.]|nr:MAG: chemotaxis protein CheW [Desulfuromonas sp.]